MYGYQRQRRMAKYTWKFKISRGLKFCSVLAATFAFLLFAFNLSALATEAKHYTDLEFAPLGEIKLPEYERYELKNGMVVYLMENHELPLVNGTAIIRTGDRLEPSNEVGLVQLVGTVMRSGGTQKHTPDQLNEILEQRAASVETSIGGTSGSGFFTSLTEDTETVFELFAEVLQQPAFLQEKIDLAKTQIRGSIARRNDNPGSIANREFRKLIYGDTSPYGRTVEYATLDNISRSDLINFYQKYYHPNNIILGIEGDFDSQKMKSLIEQNFGNWKAKPQLIKPNLPQVQQAKESGLFFVNQSQLTQSNVLIGHLGGEFNSPDYPALSVMNGVLNGFGGRLFNEVRSRQGLAYSVYGYWSPRYDYPGMFVSGGQTRSDATVQFIKSVKAEIKRIKAKPVTSKELAFAKESTLNSFVFNFQDPAQTLSRLMRYEYYGYPQDFLSRYQKGVEATTAADVQRAAQKYLQPENMVTLVVGSQNNIQPSLKQLSTQVTPIDITIPGAPSQAQS